MKRLSPTVRISVALVCLTVSLLFVALAFGLVPDRYGAVLHGRKALCEELAIHSSFSAQRNDIDAVRATIGAIVERNPDLLSVGLRQVDGRLLVAVGEHEPAWSTGAAEQSTPTHMHVPIALRDRLWGTLELRFQPVGPAVPWEPLRNPIFPLIGFMTLAGFVAYFFYLRLVFRRLNLGSSGVIPRRVRTALNTLTEGVVVLDRDQRIALANDSFARLVGRPAAALQGHKVDEFSWAAAQTTPPAAYPWDRAALGVSQMGTVLNLQVGEKDRRTLSVNSTPILADDGSRRGALATFDNLTVIEQKNSQLRTLLKKLKQSRSSIRKQNRELKVLATRDPLTRCLNRRAFFGEFENLFNGAKRYGYPLSCVMVDIDHFKTVNDNHGHQAGDQVLRLVAQTLKESVRQNDLLCRYGGEEFCVLLPHVDITGALQAAERFRSAIAAKAHGGLQVTASLGVSALEFAAADPHGLLDQADKALYAAKRGGRNRAVRWDEVPADLNIDKVKLPKVAAPIEAEADVPIPFHAVAALVSALTHRHADTAEHSKRVADLCVALAQGLMTQSQRYVLEVAALLHDIGKLGVPDRVLLKPGPLTEEEWKVVRSHERIGEEIIQAAFTSRELTDIIRCHHAWFGGSPHNPELPQGDAIPLRARILAVADAFDAIVCDRVYRKGQSREQACEELRRCAGTQFDPDLVERLIRHVLAHDEGPSAPAFFVSKQTALRIGRQIESLANALDSRDPAKLAAMAGRLNATATASGIKPIAEAAGKLQQSMQTDPDMMTVTQLTIDLLDLCRATYSSYLPSSSSGEFLLSRVEREPAAV